MAGRTSPSQIRATTTSAFLSLGDGGFAGGAICPATECSRAPVTIPPGDLNGDGSPDLVIVNQGSDNNAGVFLNLGSGTFAPMATIGWGSHYPWGVGDRRSGRR